MINIAIYSLLALLCICSLLLILVVLMQRPKNEGLGAAFGGGVTDSVLGANASNVLTKATVWLGSLFFVFTLSLAWLYSKRDQSSILKDHLKENPPVVEELTISPDASPETPASPEGDSKTEETPVSENTSETSESPATSDSPEKNN